MDIGAITVDRTFDVDRFASAIVEADDIGALIRCHYEAEQAIDYLISQLTAGRSHRKAINWNFAQKIEICHLFGVPENFTGALKLLNSHRNEIAHKGTEAVAEQQVLDLSRMIKAIYPNFGDEFRVQINGSKPYDKKFSDASLKERYVISAMMLVSLVLALPQITATSGD